MSGLSGRLGERIDCVGEMKCLGVCPCVCVK